MRGVEGPPCPSEAAAQTKTRLPSVCTPCPGDGGVNSDRSASRERQGGLEAATCPSGHASQWAEPGKEVAEAARLLGGDWRFVLTAPGLEAAAPEGGLATRGPGWNTGEGTSSGQGGGSWPSTTRRVTGRAWGMSHARAQGVPAAGRRLPWPQTWISLHEPVWSPARRARLTNTRAEAEPQNRPFPRGTGQSPGGQVDIVGPCSGVDLGLEPSGSSGHNVPSPAWTPEEELAWGWAQDLLYSVCLCLGSGEGTAQEGPAVF